MGMADVRGRFADAERAAFEARRPAAGQESDERTPLGGAATNVKIRDDLMDIKVAARGRRRRPRAWEPVMKAGVPAAAADVGTVFEALRLAGAGARPRRLHAPSSSSPSSSRPGDGVRAVARPQAAGPLLVDGCTSEVTDVVADGGPPGRSPSSPRTRRPSWRRSGALGLADYLNTSYPAGLRALLDGASPSATRCIDVGTNSIKFHVARARRRRGLADASSTAPRSRGSARGWRRPGRSRPDALERDAIDAIAGMVEEATRATGVAASSAVGTAGLRIATNRRRGRARRSREATGRRIEVDLRARRRARLAYLAVKTGLGPG